MEWNRRNIILAAVLLVLAFIPGGVIYVRSEGGLGFVKFRLEKWMKNIYGEEGSMTPKELRIAKREAERVRKIIFAKCPDLRLEGKTVDSKQNGYLALFELTEDPRLAELRSTRLLDQVAAEEFDPTAIQKQLEVFDDLGREIERIAALPERSNVIMGRVHSELLPSAEVKAMSDYLLLRARLAALDGDEADSFRFLKLAVNFTEHLGQIEGPNLLSDTVLILQRLGMYGAFLGKILPALGGSAELEKWNSILQPRTNAPQRFGQLLKGEFNYFSEKFSPLLFGEVPDPKQGVIAYARWIEASAKHYEQMTFAKFRTAKPLPHEPFTKELSREGVAILEILMIGTQTWKAGFVRSVVEEHRNAAALDLLIREQKGEDLSQQKETFLPNPLTGKPFSYDPATRTLDAITGTEGGDIEALKLPW